MQAAYQCLLCLAGNTVCPGYSQRGICFSLLIVVAFHYFRGFCKAFRFASFCGDIEENGLFFCILISGRKKVQVLLLDHGPNLSYIFS